MNNNIIPAFSNFGDEIRGVLINMIVKCDYVIIWLKNTKKTPKSTRLKVVAEWLSSLCYVRLSSYHPSPCVMYGWVLSSLCYVRLSGYHPYVTYGWVLSSLCLVLRKTEWLSSFTLCDVRLSVIILMLRTAERLSSLCHVRLSVIILMSYVT